MCAIVASFDKLKFKELYALNAYRGESSYSLATFHDDINGVALDTLKQGHGIMPEHLIEDTSTTSSSYIVCHSQAPTSQTDNIHPAVYGRTLLWHNGIIKQKEITQDTWDTEWLLESIVNYDWSSLSGIDGTFACLMYHGSDLFVFRNEISPLFIDKDLNISSTKFEKSESLLPNKVFKLNIGYKIIEPVSTFKTKENPYYIPGLL